VYARRVSDGLSRRTLAGWCVFLTRPSTLSRAIESEQQGEHLGVVRKSTPPLSMCNSPLFGPPWTKNTRNSGVWSWTMTSHEEHLHGGVWSWSHPPPFPVLSGQRRSQTPQIDTFGFPAVQTSSVRGYLSSSKCNSDICPRSSAPSNYGNGIIRLEKTYSVRVRKTRYGGAACRPESGRGRGSP
jgi:hypothetical protein